VTTIVTRRPLLTNTTNVRLWHFSAGFLRGCRAIGSVENPEDSQQLFALLPAVRVVGDPAGTQCLSRVQQMASAENPTDSSMWAVNLVGRWRSQGSYRWLRAAMLRSYRWAHWCPLGLTGGLGIGRSALYMTCRGVRDLVAIR
jgi:hypothetical protein